jgi:hypothetical protein
MASNVTNITVDSPYVHGIFQPLAGAVRAQGGFEPESAGRFGDCRPGVSGGQAALEFAYISVQAMNIRMGE